MPAGILYTHYLDRGILRVYNENIIKSKGLILWKR